MFLRTPIPTDGQLLERALDLTESQFDAMRLRFRRENGDWRQEYAAPGSSVAFERIDFAAAAPEEVASQRDRLIKELPRQLDPEHGPLVRAVWYDRGASKGGLLFLCLHHLVFDGLSVAIFVATLERLYRTLLRGGAPAEPAGCSFGEWAVALDALSQSEALRAHLPYWREVCGTATHPPVETPQAWRWTQSRSLSPKAQHRFDACFPTAQEQHNALLAAFWQAWEEETGNPELFVELEHHGRQIVAGCEPLRTAGWFVNRFPARLQAGPQAAAEERLRHVRECLRGVPLHGASFGLLAHLHRDAAIRAEVESLARPDVGFYFYGHLHDIHGPRRLFPVLREYSVNEALSSSQRDEVSLILSVNRRAGLIAWHVQFNSSVYSEEMARGVIERIEAGIETLSSPPNPSVA